MNKSITLFEGPDAKLLGYFEPTKKYGYVLTNFKIVIKDVYEVKNNIIFDKIVIPNNIDGVPIEKIGIDTQEVELFNPLSFSPAYANQMITIKNLIIPNSIKSIGTGAFEAVSYLDNVTWPASVPVIPKNCFALSSLKSINIPEGITTIDNKAFKFCELQHISLPQSLKSICLGAFSNCPHLKDIQFANGTILGKIEYKAFENTLIKKLDLSKNFGDCEIHQSIIDSIDIIPPCSLYGDIIPYKS